MTPQEKAKELFEKCYYAIPSNDMGLNDDASQKCALIAVDEILDMVKHTPIEFIETDYWQEVKQEINNL